MLGSAIGPTYTEWSLLVLQSLIINLDKPMASLSTGYLELVVLEGNFIKSSCVAIRGVRRNFSREGQERRKCVCACACACVK